jgi:acetyl-CoA acetyltransferase
MSNTEVVICSPVRTAIGTYGGTLKEMPAADLGAVAIRATLERAKLAGANIDTVGIKRGIVTLCIGGGQGIALALETIQ